MADSIAIFGGATEAAAGGGGGIAFVQSNYTTSEDYDQVVSHAMTSDVTSGNLLVVIFACGYCEGSPSPSTSWLAKTAGTATIGTVKLNTQQIWTYNDQKMLLMYSVPITGSGTLTLTHTQDTNGIAQILNCIEFEGDWTSHTIDGTNTGASAGIDEAVIQSGTVASSGESLFVGASMTDDASWTSVTIDGNFTESLSTILQSGYDSWFRAGYRIFNGTDQIEWAVVDPNYAYWRAQLVVHGEG